MNDSVQNEYSLDAAKSAVCVRIPATTANIGPGFDTFGMALGYYNYITASKTRKTTITIKGFGTVDPRFHNKNLIYQSFSFLFKKANVEVPEVKFFLENNIPLSRGLGSSSAAIVAGLYAANFFLNERFSQYDLLKTAAIIEGHPDNVTPSIMGGFVVSSMFKSELKAVKINPPDYLKIVVAIPDIKLSTKQARAMLPKEVLLADAVFGISRAALMVAAMSSGDMDLLKEVLKDRLHQPYRFKMIPGASEVVAAAINAGAIGSVLSGSGPTILAFADARRSSDSDILKIGETMTEIFKYHKVAARYLVLEPDLAGACVIDKPRREDV